MTQKKQTKVACMAMKVLFCSKIDYSSRSFDSKNVTSIEQITTRSHNSKLRISFFRHDALPITSLEVVHF